MPVQLKVGSIFRVPVMAGWKLTSGAPAVLQVVIANDIATFQAIKVGTAAITLTLAADLNVNLQVSVTAN